MSPIQSQTPLSPWEKVQLSRHPGRPSFLEYISTISTDFIQLHGDRYIADDHAILGGLARIKDQTTLVLGHQKGKDTKSRIFHNFGMARPAGYRKALRLMRLAEKFQKPILTLIDTPGAYPGIESQIHGGGEAIARNIYEMMRLKVPIISVIIGEGGSGGALGMAVADKVLMMENSWYAVVSPESCSAILWHNHDHKEEAARQLQLTADEMLHHGLIDGILPEPAGGAHCNPAAAATILGEAIIQSLQALLALTPSQLLEKRLEKFTSMGRWQERS